MYRVLVLATAFWLVAGTTAFSLPTYCDRALFAGRRPSAPQILPPAKARARHVAMRMTYEVFFWDNSLSDPSTSSPLGEVISDLVVVGALAVAAVKAFEVRLKSRLGISQGVILSKLQVAVSCEGGGTDSLLGVLSQLTQSSGVQLTESTARALLAAEGHWVCAATESQRVGGEGRDGRNVQALFAELTLDESERIRREQSFVDYGASAGTLVVVTVIVALNGQALPSVRSKENLREALRALVTLADDQWGQRLLEACLLHTSLEARLTPDVVTLNYPQLVPVED